MAGAGIAGLALTRFRTRKTPRSKQAEPLKAAATVGFAWPVAKLLFNIVRPTLISLLTARLADFAADRAKPRRSPQR